MRWWMLGVSGMASFLDITGTMVIVSFLYMFGPRGLYVEFRGGATIVLVFMLLWTGKWHRRSGCITGAEWMSYRFGETPGAHFARVVMAIGTVAGAVMLARAAAIAAKSENAEDEFYAAKCATAQFYAAHVLPQIAGLRHTIEHGHESVMALAEEAF